MPRSSKVEPCMLCGELPCACNTKKPLPKKKSERRIRRVEDTQLPESKADMRRAMKIAASDKPEPEPEPPTRWERIIAHAQEVSNETDAAIRVLLNADILHPDERAKYAHLQSVTDRAKAWKERNNASTR